MENDKGSAAALSGDEDEDFGDYLRKELLGEGEKTRTWIAEQLSVRRRVILVELKDLRGENGLPPDGQTESERKAEFIAGVRVKASVDYPVIGSIFEASTVGEKSFYTRELLPGITVAEWIREKNGGSVCGEKLVAILKWVAEANIYQENHGNSTRPLSLDAVFIDEQGVVRVENLAIYGDRSEGESLRDVRALGEELKGVPDDDTAGATRCSTLLGWMRGEEILEPLSWIQVKEYCFEIESQLAERTTLKQPESPAILPGKTLGWLWLGAGLILAGLFLYLFWPKGNSVPEKDPVEPGWVLVPAGKYTLPGGNRMRSEEFEIADAEVTIRDYAEFLESLETLSEQGEGSLYDHPEEPKIKTRHEPDDWENLYAAAKAGELWNGHRVSLDHPVVGVDWWDCYAYASYRRGSLPTQEQWWIALIFDGEELENPPVSDWLPVTMLTEDVTTNGLRGMAGNVSEWTRAARTNPGNPLGEKFWVTAGGSYLEPKIGVQTRAYENGRGVRRADLGFRIIR